MDFRNFRFNNPATKEKKRDIQEIIVITVFYRLYVAFVSCPANCFHAENKSDHVKLYRTSRIAKISSTLNSESIASNRTERKLLEIASNDQHENKNSNSYPHLSELIRNSMRTKLVLACIVGARLTGANDVD